LKGFDFKIRVDDDVCFCFHQFDMRSVLVHVGLIVSGFLIELYRLRSYVCVECGCSLRNGYNVMCKRCLEDFERMDSE